MSPHRLVLVLLLFGPALHPGCMLTVDEDELQAESQGHCPTSKKQCRVAGELSCVALSDPEFGCAQQTCVPCSLNGATAICRPDSGECAIGACTGDWEDCDGQDSNGCEVDTGRDVMNCGGCDSVCKGLPNAEVSCGGAKCFIRKCEASYADCNGRVSDGCEVDITRDPLHCGACDQRCSGSCTDGECV